MKFLTNQGGQPLLRIKGVVYNLNTLEVVDDQRYFRVKPGVANIASIRNDRSFIVLAGKYFKVTRIALSQNVRYYMLDNQMKLFCIVREDKMELMGNFPIHYLKLLYRFVMRLLL